MLNRTKATVREYLTRPATSVANVAIVALVFAILAFFVAVSR